MKKREKEGLQEDRVGYAAGLGASDGGWGGEVGQGTKTGTWMSAC